MQKTNFLRKSHENSFSLITPKKCLPGRVDSITLPTVDGEITVLPHHIPLITALGHGVITLKNNGETHFLSVSEGVVKVDKMGLTVPLRALIGPVNS